MNPSDRELVERLKQIEIDATEIGGEPHVSAICLEAHVAIEHLSKDNERLRECVRDLDGLVEHAQQILSNHLPPDGISKDDAINMLLELLDGPDQREIQSRAHSALNTTAETEGAA